MILHTMPPSWTLGKLNPRPQVGIMKLRSIEKITSGKCLVENEEGEDDMCAIFAGLEAHTSEMLQDFLLYTRSLEYEQEPDYAYLKGLIQKVWRGTEPLALEAAMWRVFWSVSAHGHLSWALPCFSILEALSCQNAWLVGW